MCVFFIILSSVVMPTHFYLKLYLLWITSLFILHITIRTLYMACSAFFWSCIMRIKLWYLLISFQLSVYWGFPVVKNPAASAGDTGSIPGGEEPLEEGMATHSRILVWRIPWTEEPDGLQSIRLQRLGHDWNNLAHMHAKCLL